MEMITQVYVFRVERESIIRASKEGHQTVLLQNDARAVYYALDVE